jgi:hypothetical protein
LNGSKNPMRSFFFFLILSVSAVLPGWSESDSLEIYINSHRFQVELADEPAERQLGLMERKSLDQDRGMLFVFPEDQVLAFWMKNTLIPLSIAYIDSFGVIREIHDMEPFSLRPVSSLVSVRYALEVNQGRFSELGIEPGHKVVFEGPLPTAAR